VSFTNCVFNDNTTHFDGTVYLIGSEGSLTLVRCSLQGNEAARGPVVFLDSGTVSLETVLGSGNSAWNQGSAVFNSGGKVSMVNTTLTDNQSVGTGGAVYSEQSSTTAITNSIIWNNTANGTTASGSCSITNDGTGTLVVESSLVQHSGSSTNWDTAMGTDGGGNLDADPVFVDSDFHLDVTSPCINLGDNGAVASSTDLDGNARIYDTMVDMGCYEAYDDGTDSDGDTLTDYDEGVHYGSDPDLADTDGDGSNDGDEAFIGSDLLSADSVCKVSVAVDGSGNVQLSWPQFNSGLRYDLYGCTNLVEGNWFYVDSTTSSNLTDAVDGDSVFYRVEVSENN
jgi:hypothetical protein